MQTKGLTVGDIKAWATADLNERLESVINAKSSMREPYWLLILFGDGYHGPLAQGNNNYLLHGGAKQKSGTKTVDMSKMRTMHQTIMILPKHKVPPVPLVGTALVYVNNKTGQVKFVYILPPDKPMIGGFDVELDSETVQKCGKGMPIVYGAEG